MKKKHKIEWKTITVLTVFLVGLSIQEYLTHIHSNMLTLFSIGYVATLLTIVTWWEEK